MEVKKIVMELDTQIARLKEARALLSDGGTSAGKRRGRPPGRPAVSSTPSKRRLSAEGRKRISDALKKRWAQRRKTVAKAAKSE